MSRLNARADTEKQIRNAQHASQDYVKGVQETQKNPMERAKAALPKMKANFLRAMDEGKVEAGLDATSFEDWKKITAKKGSERYSSGVEESRAKQIAFREEFYPHLEQVMASVESMPDLTETDREQRMLANARGIAKFKRGRRRR